HRAEFATRSSLAAQGANECRTAAAASAVDVARPCKTEQPKRCKADAEQASQHGPEGLVEHDAQGFVEAAGLLRFMGDCRVGEESGDEEQRDPLGGIADLAAPDVRRTGVAALALSVDVLQ